MNKLLKLLQWIIHSLIIALTSSLSNIYLVYKSTPNISIISSYSVHPDWFCPVPPAMASPAVTWEFFITIFKEPFPLLKQNLHSSQLSVWFSPCLYQITLFFCCNTLLALLSRSFPVSNLSSFLFIMFEFNVLSPNSISQDFKFSFRSSAMFQSLRRWTALSTLLPEIHILHICHLYPFEVGQVDFNHPFHLSNNTQAK